jgi:cytochrome c nitrite reductase small subunit
MPSPASGRRWLARSVYPLGRGSVLPWALAVATGVAAGIGAYTFSYAKGLSYFGTDPRACTNCHIMEPEYAGWQKSSHHAVAGCVDCHLPASFIPKYLAKSENGYRHGKLFTTQTFEEPITVKAAGLAILQANCERCHADLVSDLVSVAHAGDTERAAAQAGTSHGSARSDGVPCVHCHWTAGHGERASVGGRLLDAELIGQGELL